MTKIPWNIITIGLALAGAWGIYRWMTWDPLVWVTSAIDGRSYHVRDSPYKQQAADSLARIHGNLVVLIAFLNKNRGGMTQSQQSVVELIVSRYRPSRTRLSEGQLDNTVSTYTINKGEAIVFCLAPRPGKRSDGNNNNKIYDTNTLMFVAIHELAHIGCKGRDNHGPEFQSVFGFLLSQALKAGVYQHRNYIRQPQEYCNVNITSSPGLQG